MSSSPQIVLNQVPNDPTMSDLLDLLKKEIMLELNCHHVGTVQSFNAATQTVQVTINYTKTFFQLNAKTGLYDPIQVNYTPLIDCPVVVLGGGTANLTFPIAAGDECLVLFNDRDIDNWFQSGQMGPVATSRLHSFSDAFALVGVNSLVNSISNYDTVRVALRNGTAMVGVGQTLIKIANNSTTLNTLLQSLVTDIKNLVTATAALTVTGVSGGSGVSGVPSNASTITAIGTQLTILATQIGGLLE